MCSRGITTLEVHTFIVLYSIKGIVSEPVLYILYTCKVELGRSVGRRDPLRRREGDLRVII